MAWFGQVRPSVTFMISEPCPCCHATGRVEALETSFSKIEQEVSRLLVSIHGVNNIFLICDMMLKDETPNELRNSSNVLKRIKSSFVFRNSFHW